jgi:branched-chain amino acid transport system permease protein
VVDVLTIGISLGCVYGLVAMGFALIYRTTGVMNFSQGAFVMLGGMGAGYSADVWDVPLVFAALIGIGLAVLAGGVLAVLVVLPLWRRRASEFIVILATLLFLLITENVVLNLMGSDPRSVPKLPPAERLDLGFVTLDWQTIWIVIAAVLLAVGLGTFLSRTDTGTAMTAVATDREVSRMLGISPERMAITAFLVAALMGGIGGVLVAPVQFAAWSSASVYNINGFIAAIVGGLNDVRTALFGGLVVGIGQAVIGIYLSSTYLDVILMAVLVVLLLLRPGGLFSRRVAVKY